MKKVAVFLRGHLRTWEFTKHNIFEFCDNLADRVDYYVAVWRTGRDYTRFIKLQEDFNDKRLMKFEQVAGHWEYDAWLSPPYLSNMLTQARFEEEMISGQQYDAILDTRFDVIFNRVPETSIVAPEPWHVGTTRFKPEMTPCNWQGMEDHCFLMDSASHVLWNQRLHYHNSNGQGPYRPDPNNHVKLQRYAANYKLTPYEITWFKSKIIRPSVIDVKDELRSEEFSNFINPDIINSVWQNYSILQKIDCITRCNIEIEEYTSALNFTY